jgi:hypothetical protein
MSIKRKTFTCVLIVCFSIVSMGLFLLAEKEQATDKITDEDVAKAVETVNKSLGSILQMPPLKAGATDNTYWIQNEFYSKKKSSDPELVVKRITADLTAQATAWADQVLKKHTPTGKFETPIIYKKFGFSGFKFYGRVRIRVRIQCIKMPALAK